MISLVFLITSTSFAIYDVYSLGASYTSDSGYIQSMADAAGIELRAGSSLIGNMRAQVQADNVRNELASGTVDVWS